MSENDPPRGEERPTRASSESGTPRARGWAGFVPGFWQGLTSTSGLSFASLVTSTALVFAALCTFVTEEAVAKATRYLMTDPYDRATRLVAKVNGIRPHDRGTIVIVGGSRSVRCVEGEAALAQRVANRTGAWPPAVYDLSYDGQTPWEMSAIAERVRPAFPRVFVIGVNEATLSREPEDLASLVQTPRIGMISPAVDLEANALGLEVPARSGVYLLDNWRFLSLRMTSLVWNTALRTPQPDGDILARPGSDPVFRPERGIHEAAEVPALAEAYAEHNAYGFEFLGRLVDTVRGWGGTDVLLLLTPVNPAWSEFPHGKVFFDGVRADIERFAQDRGVPFLAVSGKAVFEASDFEDLEGHISNPEARVRCTEVLASEIGELLAAGGDT